MSSKDIEIETKTGRITVSVSLLTESIFAEDEQRKFMVHTCKRQDRSRVMSG